MARPPPSPPVRGAPGTVFRLAIEAALAEGVAAEDMTLRLTNGDATKLKRDPQIPLADISFARGEMRFLGVKVEAGGVPASLLDRGGA